MYENPCYLWLKLRDDWCVIGGFFPGARCEVDPCANTSRDEGLGDPHVIDTQAEVAAKGAGAVIPPGKMAARFCVQSKGVSEAPILYALQRRLFLLAEHDPPVPQPDVMHIALFGSDIEITT